MNQSDFWVGGVSGLYRRRPTHFSLVVAALLVAVFAQPEFVLAQSGYEEGDIVTFADSRDVSCGDITPREVVFATNGGVWRLDRSTGEILDPWYFGIGRDRAQNLSGAKVILWHEVSASIWLATSSGVYYYRWGPRLWYKLEGIGGNDITSLGEKRDSVFVVANGRIGAIDPFAFRFAGWVNTDTSAIRWTGKLNKQPVEYPSLGIDDYYYRYERHDGRLVTRDFDEYVPTYTFIDQDYRKRYICYPGLGIGVADDRKGELTLVQTGPSGKDVRGIAFEDEVSIWVGGDNDDEGNGISKFNRETKSWTRYSRKMYSGLESTVVSDLLYSNRTLYAATSAGLVTFDEVRSRWNTYGRLEGAPGNSMRALSMANGWLILGGDDGGGRMLDGSAIFFKLENPALKDLRIAQIASDKDTVWIAGQQGAYKGTAEGKWRIVTGDRTIGDEAARSIAVSQDLVCIGGQSGVRIYNRTTGEWYSILASTYLNCGQTLSIAIADSLVWIGSDKGLFRYNRKQGSFLHFGQEEGLPSPRINRIVVESDSLWLGTTRGLVRFIWNRPNRDID